MRIDEFHIDGFGEFFDRPFGPLDSPLTIVYGPNEAGKSTLLSYLRQILFGFPSGRSSENRYATENARRHGGSILSTMDDGSQIRIARHGGGPAIGTVALQYADNTSIDASELPRLLGHATKSVFESIFAFDLRELSSFNEANNAEIASLLYGAGMSTPRLPVVLREIEKTRGDIFRSGGQNQPVAQALRQLEETEAKLRAVQHQVLDYRNYKQELLETDNRVDEISRDIKLMQSRRGLLIKRVAAWDTWIDLRNVRERLEDIPVFEEFPEDAVSRLELLEEKLQEDVQAVESATTKHEVEVDSAAVAIPNESLLGRSSDIKNIVELRGAFVASVRDLPERQSEVDADEARLAEDLDALGPGWTQKRIETFDSIIARRDQIEQSRTALDKADQDFRDRELEIDRIETDLADVKLRRKEFDVDSVDEKPHRQNPRRLVLAIAVAVIGGLLTGGGVMFDSPILLGLGLGSGSIGLFGAGVLLFYRDGQQSSRSHADQGRFLEARRSEERLRRLLGATEQAKIVSQEYKEHTQAKWNEWLNSNGLTESLSPTGASEFVTRIEASKGRFGVARGRQERVQAIQHDIDEYRVLVSDVSSGVNIELGTDTHSVLTASTSISEFYDAARTAERERNVSKESVPELFKELGEIRRRQERIVSDYKELLLEGGTDDPEEFRRSAAQHSRRQQLTDKERDLSDNLRHIVGPDYELSDLDTHLANSSLENMNTELSSLNTELTDAEEIRVGFHNRHGELTVEIAKLQSDEDASKLRARRASLVETLQDHASEWSRYSMAMAILDLTRQKYEKERQPAILEKASGYFKEFTDGRYDRVFSRLGESVFQVAESGPSRRNKSPEELSRATLEQLYLAMRFAAVEEFGERQERLPVIVDEVLVNFDPVRASKAAAAFGRIADHNQVIVFTCHPWIRDLFQDAIPEAGLLNLNGNP